jgi:hypothetical protein
MARQNGLGAVPDTVVEIGPGNSIGVGLAALLSGTNRYIAFDSVRHTDLKQDERVLDELVILFQAHHQEVSPARLEAIRGAIASQQPYHGISIAYVAPWDGMSSGPLSPESVDMICSHVVMEYVRDVEATYALFATWLKPGGVVSHQIDFSSHKLTRHWNGQWAYSAKTWRFLEGTRPIRLNRQAHSAHLNGLKQHGLHLVCDIRTIDKSGILRGELAPEFANVTDEDLVTRAAFMQALKSTSAM